MISTDIGRRWRLLDTQEEREALISEGLRRFPEDPEVLYLAAATFLEEQQRSRDYARQAVAHAHDPDLLTECGRLLIDLSDFEGATMALKGARPFVEEGFALDGELLHLAGALAAQRGDVEQAKALLAGLFAEDPDIVGLGYDLADLHLAADEIDEAVAVLDKALEYPHDHRRLTDLRDALENIQVAEDTLATRTPTRIPTPPHSSRRQGPRPNGPFARSQRRPDVESSSPRSKDSAPAAREVYKLGFEADDYASLAADRADERDRVGRLDGSSRAEGWQPPGLHWDLSGARPIPDFCDWNSLPIFSSRAAQALGDLLDGRGEWLELDISAGPQDYRVFNITRLSGVLDEDAADVHYAPDDPGKILWIDRWAVHAELLVEETIFKLARDPAAERYVTDVVRDRIEQASLTGFWWRSRLYPRTEPDPVPDPEPGSRVYTQLVPDPDDTGDPDEVVAHRIVPAFEADNADLYEAQARADQLGIGPDDGCNGAFLTRRAHRDLLPRAPPPPRSSPKQRRSHRHPLPHRPPARSRTVPAPLTARRRPG